MEHGLGSDLSCAFDLEAGMVELSGDDPRLVAQACIRRLSTPRGALLDDPDYGFDLLRELRSPARPEALVALPSLIRAELTKDDRVGSLDIRATLLPSTKAPTVELVIRGDTAAGPFTLTGNLTQDSIRLEITQ